MGTVSSGGIKVYTRSDPRTSRSSVASLVRLLAFLLVTACLLPIRSEEIPEITVVGESVPSESDLHLGGLEFNPYVAARAEYNDNLFYEPSGKQSDITEILTPGLRMAYPFANHRLQFDWQSSIRHYNNHTELNTISEHLGSLQLNLDYDRWFIQLRDGFAYLDEVGDPEFLTRAQRWINDGGVKAGVRFKPLDFTVDYTKSLHRWVWDPLHDLNYTQDTYGAQIDFKTFQTLKPYLRYEFQQYDFDGNLNIAKYGHLRRNNQDRHMVLAGLNGTVVENLTWEVAVGWQHIWLRTYHDYFEPELAPRDSDHLVAKIRATWHVQPETFVVSAFMDRSAILSTAADYADVTTVGGEVMRKWTDRWKSSLAVTHSYYNRPKGADFDYFAVKTSTTYRINKWASLLMRYEFTLDTPRNIGDGYNQSRITFGGLFAW